MTGYAKLRNDLWSNEKMRRIADRHPREFALWVVSISYCSDKLTDGVLSDYAIHRIIGVKPRQLQRMFDLNLWEKHDGIVQVHDYLKTQNSRESIEKNHERKARNQAEYMERIKARDRSYDRSADRTPDRLDDSEMTRENLKPKTYKPKTTKEREEKRPPTPDDVENWEPKPHHYQTAVALADKGYPMVDVTDLGTEFRLSLQAKGLDHYGYRDLDAAFLQWLNKRAKSLRDARQSVGFGPMSDAPRVKPHRHTWKCPHVLRILRRDEATADPDALAQRCADLLNQGDSEDRVLEALGLDESEEVA